MPKKKQGAYACDRHVLLAKLAKKTVTRQGVFLFLFLCSTAVGLIISKTIVSQSENSNVHYQQPLFQPALRV